MERCRTELARAEIKLYGADTDSGTFDYFTEVIVGQTGKSRSDYHQSEDDNTLVMGVAGDKFALGYFGLAYYEENQDKLKLLGVDPGDGNCVKPTPETVRDNTYSPLSRPLFIYVRTSSLSRPEVKSFVEFYLNTVHLGGRRGRLRARAGRCRRKEQAGISKKLWQRCPRPHNA